MSRSIGRAAALPLVLLAAAWCCMACAAQPVDPAASAIAGMPLADFAHYVEGRNFYGTYLFGHKVGWISDESRVTQYGGAAVLEDTSELHMEVGVGRKRTVSITREVTRYLLDGTGAIVSMETLTIDDGSRVLRSAVREGEQLRITTRENGKTSERLTPLSRDTLKIHQDVVAWLAGPRRKGDRIMTFEASLDKESIDDEEPMEFLAFEPLVWGGVPVKAGRVEIHMGGPNLYAWLGPDGKPMRGKVAGLVEFRAEKEEVAKALDREPVDMLAASSIKVSRSLGDRDSITSLTLELSGLGDYRLPADTRQRVQRSGKGSATVQLVRESGSPAAAPLTPQERAQFLRSTPSVQSDDASIQQLAREIAGDETDPVKISARIVEWIARNMRRSYGANASTATAVLAQRAGDCTEHALLFTALARAAGVPARELGGLIYVEDPAPLFGWHEWAEIHDGRGWISVDPTWSQLPVDATHVQFSADDNEMNLKDSGWIEVLGKLKIAVKKVDRQGG